MPRWRKNSIFGDGPRRAAPTGGRQWKQDCCRLVRGPDTAGAASRPAMLACSARQPAKRSMRDRPNSDNGAAPTRS